MLITPRREILELKPYDKYNYTWIRPLLSFSDVFDKTSFSLLAKASYGKKYFNYSSTQIHNKLM